ncbi:hypothetical protein CFN78_26065 [Amycolatopsis antarctica]|uniref:Uncharacterized protein n=1 Tax=Amycolatopsis antarctica TaxID=1854586 RepID=A0A263CZ60_9PSEU|nr:hypothetical protein [Amycolatopsis antarctica]OZM70385.1 hypothetical protein CFN78_26065 [Amycolatopsis antarctica]
MTGQLNTTVNGHPGSCIEAADWLSAFDRNAESAVDRCHDASAIADSGWNGPASAAFRTAIMDPRLTCNDLAFTCRLYEQALRDFGEALERVVGAMNDALAHAGDNGLEVHGPFVLPPEPPPTTTVEDFTDPAQTYADISEKTVGYNTKAEAFNECSDLVADARRREGEAHANLLDALTPLDDGSEPALPSGGVDAWSVGQTVLSGAVDYVEFAKQGQLEAMRNADRFTQMGMAFYQVSMGALTDLKPGDRDQLEQALRAMRGITAADGVQQEYYKRADEYLQLLDKAPKSVELIAKKLPYAGSLLESVNQALGAVKGEQSWPEAVARTGGVLAGSFAGGVAGSQVGVFVGGPVGAVLGGVGGSVLGGISAELGLDVILPGEEPDPYAQPKVYLKSSPLG